MDQPASGKAKAAAKKRASGGARRKAAKQKAASTSIILLMTYGARFAQQQQHVGMAKPVTCTDEAPGGFQKNTLLRASNINALL